jgi:AcrR family transcriptional regulator
VSQTRDDLLEAALRLLEAEGPEALQARRLTAEIGASTMAVYTHFGGLPGLVEEMVKEGLARFAAHVRRVPETDDPMADLMSGGLAYGEFAFQNPQLYRFMFGLANGAALGKLASTVDAADIWDLPEGTDAFAVLLGSVTRVIEAGEFRPQDPLTAAVQVLSVTHGYLLLGIGGFLTDQVPELMAPLAVNLMVGLGADRKKAERSLARALQSRAG